MRKLFEQSDLSNFAHQYEMETNLPIAIEYLAESCVYGFYKKEELVGGFVLNENGCTHAIEKYSTGYKKNMVYRFISNADKTCELNYFWMSSEIKNSIIYSARLWLEMASIVKKSHRPFVVYATSDERLARVFHYPKKSVLVSRDVIGESNAYLFLSKTKDFFWGVVHIVLSKLTCRPFVKRRQEDTFNRYDLRYELGR